MKRLLVIALLVVPFLNVVAQEVTGPVVVDAFDKYSTSDEDSVKVLIKLAEKFKADLGRVRNELQGAIDDNQKKLKTLTEELAEKKAAAEKEAALLKEQLAASELGDAEKAKQLDALKKEYDDLKKAQESLATAKTDLDEKLQAQEEALTENKTLSAEQSKELEASRKAFDDAKGEYEKEKAEYERKVAELNASLAQTKDTAEQSSGEVKRLNGIITQLNKKIKTSQEVLTAALGTLREEKK